MSNLTLSEWMAKTRAIKTKMDSKEARDSESNKREEVVEAHNYI